MEVLISMFILAVGLLGVAALIPAGRQEIVEAAKLDNAAMVGRAAFRDIQVRGYLNPVNWRAYPSSWTAMYNPSKPATPFQAWDTATGSLGDFPHVAYLFDPLGLRAPAGAFDTAVPHAASLTGPVAPLVRISPIAFPTGTTTQQELATFDSLFRSSFDYVLQPSGTNPDFPPVPRWFVSGSNSVRRMNEGNYSWMATLASDPTRVATSGEVTVSVAVFYKRSLNNPSLNEASSEVTFPTTGSGRITSGSSLGINTLPTDLNGKPRALKPGQWIMLAGSVPSVVGGTTVNLSYYRWYKILSAAAPVSASGVYSQQVAVAGSDWNCAANRTRAWIFENIVNVYEKQMPLEIN